MKNNYKFLLAVIFASINCVGTAQLIRNITVTPVGDQDLTASLEVKFMGDTTDLDEGEIESNGWIYVTVKNGPGGTPSKLTQFFLLNPIEGQDELMDEGDATAITPVPFISDKWSLQTNLSNDLQGAGGYIGHDSNNAFHYFGMVTGGDKVDALSDPDTSDDGLDQTVGNFYFHFGDLNNQVIDVNYWFNSWNDSSKPLAFVRWQTVGETGADSAKGIGWGNPDFGGGTIPEPSEVALMAMLGLGGLLFARRRFAKKK